MHKNEAELARLNRLANLLDSKFRIPYTQFRIGLDGLIGLVPIYGDVVSFLLSFIVIVMIARMGVPTSVLIRVCMNSLLDFVIGLVPFAGDLADIFFKSNLRNVRLVQRYYATPQRVKTQSFLLILSLSVGILLILLLVVGTLLWLVFQLLSQI
ncbi:MAG: DUF4112 domain-containing protein [Bdellovibrionota bacterium]